MSTSNSRDALADGNIPAWIISLAPDHHEVITVPLPSGETCTAILATIGRTSIGFNPGTNTLAVDVHEDVYQADESFHAMADDMRAVRDSVARFMASMPPVPLHVPADWM